jgi:hypothetical protein
MTVAEIIALAVVAGCICAALWVRPRDDDKPSAPPARNAKEPE